MSVGINESKKKQQLRCAFRGVLLSLVTFCLVACGYRTAPQPDPVKPQLKTFQNPKAIHRGESLRLSWQLIEPELLKELVSKGKLEDHQFEIETLIRKEPCSRCELRVGPKYMLDSNSLQLEREGNLFYFFPPLSANPQEVTLFKIRHVYVPTNNLISVSDFVSAGLPTNFVRVPQVIVEELKQNSLTTNLDSLLKQSQILSRKLKDVRVIKMLWKPLSEIVEFRWQNDKFLAHNQKYFRTNIYRSEDGRRWPETPITMQPIEGNFALVPELRSIPGHYHIRWVDSSGNESLPSTKITYAK
jgi:hypothetical protein